MIRRLIYLAFAAMLTGVVMAQDVSVRSDHPDEYTVIRGDTLWDISGRFLDKPWQWPAIWHANPQIDNPHLIYPGDVISLVYIDGVPQLRLRRGGPVKLSPAIRVVDDAIKAVPFDRIKPFIRDIRVLSPSEFEGLPYIVANNEDRLNASHTDSTYARGLNARAGEEFVVARLTSIYDSFGKPPETRRVNPPDKREWVRIENVWDHNDHIHDPTPPWHRKAKNPIGYEMLEISRVRVTQAGEISVMDILQDLRSVQPGDYILPVSDMGYDKVFYPSAMDSIPDGLRVLATSGQKSGVGLYQIVAINGGTRQGLQNGHVFSAFRQGLDVKDRTGYRWGSFAKASDVRLPDVYDGLVMVFRTFDDISYGMVLSGKRVVEAYDQLRHPDERM